MSPHGNRKGLAPKFCWKSKNLLVINQIWPKPEKILDKDGKDTGYMGYTKDFSVLFSLKIQDDVSRIEGNVFYASCGDFCRPHDVNFSIWPDGKLLGEEVDSVLLDESIPYGFLLTLLLSFLGGIILNCMPCVFPIISLKVFSILKSGSGTNLKKEGILFSAGCIFTLLIIGFLIILLRFAGSEVGWGFFMQSPIFVSFLSFSFIFVALLMFGILNIGGFGVDCISNFFRKSENVAIKSFLGGVISSVSSAMCVGPFVGASITSALLFHDNVKSALIFLSIGLGVSFPILIVSIVPVVGRYFPKPGMWMENVKKSIGFLMLLSCTWLYSVLASQIGSEKLIMVIATAVIFSFFVWVYGQSCSCGNCRRRVMSVFSIIGMISSVFSPFYIMKIEKACGNASVVWEPFSFEKLKKYREDGKSILLNFTADWCLNCKLNEAILIDDDVVSVFRKNDVVCMRLDWTSMDSEITKLLKSFGHTSIPLFVFHKQSSSVPIIFSGLISKDDILGWFVKEE